MICVNLNKLAIEIEVFFLEGINSLIDKGPGEWNGIEDDRKKNTKILGIVTGRESYIWLEYVEKWAKLG